MMIERIQLAVAVSALTLVVACTTGDKGATPADTATGQTTTVAPASASAPVLSAPVLSAPVLSAPVDTTRPKATGTTKTATEPMRDSAFKPRATVDEKGNIQPIKRDSLR